VLSAVRAKVADPTADLQVAAMIEQRLRTGAEAEAIERAIRGEIYRPAGGRSPSPSPVVPEQFRTASVGARGGRPRDVSALLDEQLRGRARPSSLSSRILLGLVMLVPISIVGVPALLIVAGIAGSIQKALAPAPHQAPAPAAVVSAPAPPPQPDPTPAPAPVVGVDSTPTPGPAPTPVARKLPDLSRDPDPGEMSRSGVPAVVVPAFPDPPTAQDLRRPQPSPGEVEMKERIGRLEALGVICSPSRSRFLSPPPAPQAGG
jgi:hypothetical protein